MTKYKNLSSFEKWTWDAAEEFLRAGYSMGEISDIMNNDEFEEDMKIAMEEDSYSNGMEYAAMLLNKWSGVPNHEIRENMKAKIVKESLNEKEGIYYNTNFKNDTPADQGSRAAKQDNYRILDVNDQIDVLTPAITAIKGILQNPEIFDPAIISDLTDTFFALETELQKSNNELEMLYGESIKESLNEGFATEEGRNLDKIAGWLGYDDLHEMLGDNPGLYEACIEWIDIQFGEQLTGELIDDGRDPSEVERVGLYNVAEEVRKYQRDQDVDESGITGMHM